MSGRKHRRVQVVDAREGSIRSNACCAGHSSGIGRGPPSVHQPSVTRGQSEDQEKQSGGKTATAGASYQGSAESARRCRAEARPEPVAIGSTYTVAQRHWGSRATGGTVDRAEDPGGNTGLCVRNVRR